MLMIAVISLFVITVDIVSAPVSFTDYPTEDVTVAEGVSVQFTCSATVGGTRRDVTWGIQLTEADTPDIFTSNKTFRDTSTFVSVGSEFRSPLILTNVSRELDRATVQCRASDGLSVFQQPEPRPVIRVLCELQ